LENGRAKIWRPIERVAEAGKPFDRSGVRNGDIQPVEPGVLESRPGGDSGEGHIASGAPVQRMLDGDFPEAGGADERQILGSLEKVA
jgi:hypothetical protein